MNWDERVKQQVMGKKITLKIVNQGLEKVIRVRENITINNLKAIIEGILL